MLGKMLKQLEFPKELNRDVSGEIRHLSYFTLGDLEGSFDPKFFILKKLHTTTRIIFLTLLMVFGNEWICTRACVKTCFGKRN